ncbi:hypothetical protein GPJ59_24195, partial [Streptomyces bambusae]|nr:hypothetical protein [Streptomyces bambusae]
QGALAGPGGAGGTGGSGGTGDELTRGDLTHGDLPRGELTRESAREVLESAAGSLVTADAGRYALAHAGYGAHVLEPLGLTAREGHRRIHDALTARAGGDWAHADAYTRAFLAVHAAQAGADRLRELLDDPEFLVHTDPDVLLPLAVTQLGACEGAALYLRVADAFRSRPETGTRRALLRAAAFVSHRELHRRLASPGFRELPWEERWTDAGPVPVDLRWPAARGGARALHWSGAPGDTVLSVGVIGEVAVHAPASGKQRLTRRTPDRSRSVRQVTGAATAAGHRTTVASDGEGVFLWDDASGLPGKVFDWGGAAKSLTALECAGDFLVMAADGQRVWAWRWSADRSASEAALAGVLALAADRVALVPLGSRYFLLSAGTDTELHEIHPAGRGARLLGPRRALPHTGRWPVRATAVLPEPPRRRRGEERPAGCAWLACVDGHTADVWQLAEAGPGQDVTVDHALSLQAPDARGVALGYWQERPLLVLHQGSFVAVHDIAGGRRLCAFPVHGHRDAQALACAPDGSGRIAVSDGPHVRILDVAAAAPTRATGLDRSYTERLVVELAAGPAGTPALLCRVAGGLVVAGYPSAGPGPGSDSGAGAAAGTGAESAVAAGAVAELRHDRPVTAVRALWCRDRWLIACAFGRTVRVWTLAPDLGTAAAPYDIPLHGDGGDITRGLGLVLEQDGRPGLFIPDSRQVRRLRLLDGGWTPDGAVDVVAHALSVRAMKDGTTWAVIDTGRGFRAWEATRGVWETSAFLADSGRRSAMVALGEHHVMGRSDPLVAWAERDVIHLAVHKHGRWITRRPAYDGGTPSALVFTGEPERPLLVVCGGERTLAVLEAAARRPLPLPNAVVPWRGMDIEAAAAVSVAGQGILLALQDRQRCDQILLRADALAPRGGRRTSAVSS